MHPFEAYLKEKNLEALDVLLKAKIRYMYLYHATKGIPISPENAQKIRLVLWEMTGEVYRGEIVVTHPEEHDMPTIPIKKISKQ